MSPTPTPDTPTPTPALVPKVCAAKTRTKLIAAEQPLSHTAVVVGEACIWHVAIWLEGTIPETSIHPRNPNTTQDHHPAPTTSGLMI